MKFEHLKDLSPEKFRRITGVKPATFNKMVSIVRQVCAIKEKRQKSPGGRKHNLSYAFRLYKESDVETAENVSGCALILLQGFAMLNYKIRFGRGLINNHENFIHSH